MIKIIFSIIFFVIPALLFWFDVVFSFKKSIIHFHIGKWDSDVSWEKAVYKKASSWNKYMPKVRIDDKKKYELISIVKRKNSDKSVQSWQNGMLNLGLFEYEIKERNFIDSKKYLVKFISNSGQWKFEVNRIDYALLAYSILKVCDNKLEFIKPAMDEVIEVIEKNICTDGMVSYSQGADTVFRYVDTLGMVCPFLALYGKKYNDEKYIQLAIDQIRKFRENGVLADYALPCHAYNGTSFIPFGIYGWGRGTAWYFLAIVDTWRELDSSESKNFLAGLMLEAATKYVQFQQSDGGFLSILQGGGQYDSSVTAAMAYLYKVCGMVFNRQDFLDVHFKCLRKIKSVTMKSGAIDLCQGDTHGIGVFSRDFDIMPFAQGLVLRALSFRKDLVK